MRFRIASVFALICLLSLSCIDNETLEPETFMMEDRESNGTPFLKNCGNSITGDRKPVRIVIQNGVKTITLKSDTLDVNQIANVLVHYPQNARVLYGDAARFGAIEFYLK